MDMPAHLLTIDINSLTELNQMYIPFLKNGGLFLPTNNYYQMHDQVNVNLHLLGEKFTFTGTIVWMPAQKLMEPLTKNIGVEFDAAANKLREKIASFLLLKTEGKSSSFEKEG